MKRVLTALAVLTLVSLAKAAFPGNAQAGEMMEAGSWADVCCGSTCGTDFCVGSGTYTCCKT